MSERVGLAELETNERKALANAVQALEENRFPSRVDWRTVVPVLDVDKRFMLSLMRAIQGVSIQNFLKAAGTSRASLYAFADPDEGRVPDPELLHGSAEWCRSLAELFGQLAKDAEFAAGVAPYLDWDAEYVPIEKRDQEVLKVVAHYLLAEEPPDVSFDTGRDDAAARVTRQTVGQRDAPPQVAEIELTVRERAALEAAMKKAQEAPNT